MLDLHNDANKYAEKLKKVAETLEEARELYIKGQYFSLLNQDYEKVKLV